MELKPRSGGVRPRRVRRRCGSADVTITAASVIGKADLSVSRPSRGTGKYRRAAKKYTRDNRSRLEH